MRSSNSSSWYAPMAMKAVIVSSGVVSATMMLKWSVPVIVEFVMLEVPLFWSLALSWMQPPYLYLLINCIILSIVASSKLHPHPHPHEQQDMDSPASLPEIQDEAVAPAEAVLFGCVDENPSTVIVACDSNGQTQEEETQRVEDDEEFVVSRSTWTPPKREKADEYSNSNSNSNSKPPVSARFAHRKAAKPTPEGKAVLRVARPRRQETLESTWRTITDGRPMPLKRHLRKSDTFAGAGDESPVRVMKKSETFAGGSSSPASGGSSSGGRLRREPSLSQDELNRRVEAFIKKFNEEIRLQRQESLNHYQEMVGRGLGPTETSHN